MCATRAQHKSDLPSPPPSYIIYTTGLLISVSVHTQKHLISSISISIRTEASKLNSSMADTKGRSTTNPRRSPSTTTTTVDNQQQKGTSRLQKRAPASIQVAPASSFASGWKVAIPLLSPLVLSPTSPPRGSDRTVESKPEESSRQDHRQIEKPKPSFKTWQHPAGPFHYEPGPPIFPSFVPRCR